MATLSDVSGSGSNFTGKLDRVKVSFGRVPEQAAWKSSTIQSYHQNRYWWLTTDRDEDRNKVFIFKDKPEAGRELDLSKAVAVVNKDDIKI